MPDEFRVVSTSKSGWKRHGEWTGPAAARRLLEVVIGLPSTGFVAVDLEKRKGPEGRAVLRYERVDNGPWERLSADQLVELVRGGLKAPVTSPPVPAVESPSNPPITTETAPQAGEIRLQPERARAMIRDMLRGFGH